MCPIDSFDLAGGYRYIRRMAAAVAETKLDGDQVFVCVQWEYVDLIVEKIVLHACARNSLGGRLHDARRLSGVFVIAGRSSRARSQNFDRRRLYVSHRIGVLCPFVCRMDARYHITKVVGSGAYGVVVCVLSLRLVTSMEHFLSHIESHFPPADCTRHTALAVDHSGRNDSVDHSFAGRRKTRRLGKRWRLRKLVRCSATLWMQSEFCER